jgi:hypothetical protein
MARRTGLDPKNWIPVYDLILSVVVKCELLSDEEFDKLSQELKWVSGMGEEAQHLLFVLDQIRKQDHNGEPPVSFVPTIDMLYASKKALKEFDAMLALLYTFASEGENDNARVNELWQGIALNIQQAQLRRKELEA